MCLKTKRLLAEIFCLTLIVLLSTPAWADRSVRPTVRPVPQQDDFQVVLPDGARDIPGEGGPTRPQAGAEAPVEQPAQALHSNPGGHSAPARAAVAATPVRFGNLDCPRFGGLSALEITGHEGLAEAMTVIVDLINGDLTSEPRGRLILSLCCQTLPQSYPGETPRPTSHSFDGTHETSMAGDLAGMERAEQLEVLECCLEKATAFEQEVSETIASFDGDDADHTPDDLTAYEDYIFSLDGTFTFGECIEVDCTLHPDDPGCGDKCSLDPTDSVYEIGNPLHKICCEEASRRLRDGEITAAQFPIPCGGTPPPPPEAPPPDVPNTEIIGATVIPEIRLVRTMDSLVNLKIDSKETVSRHFSAKYSVAKDEVVQEIDTGNWTISASQTTGLDILGDRSKAASLVSGKRALKSTEGLIANNLKKGELVLALPHYSNKFVRDSVDGKVFKIRESSKSAQTLALQAATVTSPADLPELTCRDLVEAVQKEGLQYKTQADIAADLSLENKVRAAVILAEQYCPEMVVTIEVKAGVTEPQALGVQAASTADEDTVTTVKIFQIDAEIQGGSGCSLVPDTKASSDASIFLLLIMSALVPLSLRGRRPKQSRISKF